MIYGDSKLVANKLFIFDDVYRNALEKQRIGSNQQFFYYKTLGKIRDKFRKKNKGIQNSLFEQPQHRNVESRESMPITTSRFFDIEKINNKLFKIHKSAIYGEMESKPSSYTARTTGRSSKHLQFEAGVKKIEIQKPKLEDIVSMHRKLKRFSFTKEPKRSISHYIPKAKWIDLRLRNLTPHK